MSTDHLLPAETTTLDPTLDRQLIADIRAAGENEDAARDLKDWVVCSHQPPAQGLPQHQGAFSRLPPTSVCR